ncbi:hypothetical protein HOO65_090068 [Ceratocystis lukuohia]|uniref:SRR1-like domain-containing protein n=1 Tax=Ceratocystis lukuohia TaxID=2019550 RepID=A0ABR4M930_9PEZI
MSAAEPAQEWTYVRRGKKSRRTVPATSQLHSERQRPQESSSLPQPPAVMLDEICKTHESLAQKWDVSACRKDLVKLLADRKGLATVKVARAVCLGVGSFGAVEIGWLARKRAHMQVLAFLDIVKSLNQNVDPGAATIKCFFQEPAFTSEDCRFIKSLGHEVVISPAGFECVDENTFVFGIHLYAEIYSKILSRNLPAIFIGTSWDEWENVSLSGTNKKPHRIADMDAAYNKADFPQDDNYTFSSTVVYWKTAREDDGAGKSETDEKKKKAMCQNAYAINGKADTNPSPSYVSSKTSEVIE